MREGKRETERDRQTNRQSDGNCSEGERWTETQVEIDRQKERKRVIRSLDR